MMQMTYQKFGVLLLLFLGIGLLIARGAPAGAQPSGDGEAILQAVQTRTDHVMPLDLARAVIEGSKEYFIVDTRQPWEFDDYHIPGAVNIPLVQLVSDKARSELPKDKTIVLYSAGGTHAAQGWVVLTQEGYRARSLLDGMQGWWRDVMTPTSLKIDDEAKDALEYKGAKSMREYFERGAAPSGSTPPPVTVVPTTPSMPPPSATTPMTPPAAKSQGGGC